MNKEILSQLIQKTGLTHREFAKKVGTNEVQVSKWLSGTRNIREKRLLQILTLFNYKISFEILAQ